MECEKLERLYEDLQKTLGREVLEPEFFEDLYRELTRALGGMVPDWVKVDEELLGVLRRHLEKFKKCEFIHAVLAPSHFHPCESGAVLLEMLEDFFDICEEIYFYPLEDTLHIAVMFGRRAVSFPSEESQTGYTLQLAGMCGVRVELKAAGECAFFSSEVAEEYLENFEKVAIFGRVKMLRVDLDSVLKLGGDSREDVSLFFKKGGTYNSVLSEHPLFYDFVVETGASPEELNGKVPLGEIARVETLRRRRFVRKRALAFDGCRARFVENEFVERGSAIITGPHMEIVRVLLNTQTVQNLLEKVPLEGIPVPEDLTEKEAMDFEKNVKELERKLLRLQNTS